MASPARSRWILAAVLMVSIVVAWRIRSRAPVYPTAYIADNATTLWSTMAQVRRAVATLGYGERVAVMRRSGDMAEVRSDDGAHGWMDARQLMNSDMWRKVGELLARAQAMPVQAEGHMRALSNIHTEPGRDAPRLLRFGRGEPVAVLERRVLPAPAAAASQSGEDAGSSAGDNPKQEDWLFVLRGAAQDNDVAAGNSSSGTPAAVGAAFPGKSETNTAGAGFPVAGWTLGRFVDLDPPGPIRDYSSTAGMHVVSWAVLNTVPDVDGAKPQYLVAATRGGEGQPCDFTLLRVYTWSTMRKRYETAYIESNLCGHLPILVRRNPADIEFRFMELDEAQQRVYRMKQTTVRRVKSDEPANVSTGKRR